MNFRRILPTTILGLAAMVAFVRADDDLGALVSQPGLFSYQAPQGWIVKDSPIYKYKVAFDRANGSNFAANIHLLVQDYPRPLDQFVEASIAQLKTTPLLENIEIVDQAPFETASGLKGTRVVVKDTLSKLDMQQIFYFFQGSGTTKMVAVASCLIDDADKYASLFDASLNTFSLDQASPDQQ